MPFVMRLFSLLLLCSLLSLPLAGQRNVLEKIIKNKQKDFSAWAQDPAKYEVQLIYTQIDRDAENRPTFTTHTYGIDPLTYFYPASTVKMPAAFLALEKIHKLGILDLDRDTPLRIGATRSPQTSVVVDQSTASGLPSIGHYVRQVFLVSDNDAFNRMYEFLGQRPLNERLQAKGYTDSRIIHRLSVPGYDSIGNRYTNPITFYDVDTLRYYQGPVYSRFYNGAHLTQQVRGQAYVDQDGEVVQEPFDFSYKNFVSLRDLHDMLRAVIFPEAVQQKERFDLSPDDYSFLYKAMGQRPRESDYPRYDKPDNYVKFWMYGDQPEEEEIPSHIRIFNKVGWAYGFLSDISYVIDTQAGIEFFIGGVIHVNANETFNDGVYEYETIGLPFFGEMGRAIYDYELSRKRRHRPDFTRFDLF